MISTIPQFKAFLGGTFYEGEQLPVLAPFDGHTLANACLANEEMYEMALAKALESAKPLQNLPAYKRYEILMHIASRLKEDREILSLLLAREAAKPLKFARAEVDRSIQTFIVAAEESKRLPKEYISLDWTAAGANREGIIKYFPVGPVAGISPFNFPLNLAVHKIAPAIAAGCPIVLKPASSTPLSALFLAQIIAETDLPPGAVSILPMNRNFANRMVSDERFAMLSFTGSPEVGWKMKAGAGKKKTTLELGGNAAVIISEHTDVESLIDKCMNGAYAYQGQVCIHAQRFFVHQKHEKRFLELFTAAAEKLQIGAPEDERTDFSCMIDEANAERVDAWVNEAELAGASVLLKPRKKGNMIYPTLITGARKNMKVYDEEVFGPVITVNTFTDFSDALERVNDSRFGLQAGLFSEKQTEIDAAFNGLHLGGLVLNDTPILRLDHMPYGGVKDSGLGREGVKYTIADMMEPRILLK